MNRCRAVGKLTCQVDTGPAPQVPSHQLTQVVAGSLIPEPVAKPAGLVGHQDDLVPRTHALICNPGKVSAMQLAGSACSQGAMHARQGKAQHAKHEEHADLTAGKACWFYRGVLST